MNEIEQVFKYQSQDGIFKNIATWVRHGEPWFLVTDTCKILTIKNVGNVIASLDKCDIHTMDVKVKGRNNAGKTIFLTRKITVCNEAGFYQIIFQSKKPEAKRFLHFVTHVVLPSIRKTGKYELHGNQNNLPDYIRRLYKNSNIGRIKWNYFSVIKELFLILHAYLESHEIILPEMYRLKDKWHFLRPDISVGKLFLDWLRINYPNLYVKYPPLTYKHVIDNGRSVDALQYPVELQKVFKYYVLKVWLKDRLVIYLQTKNINPELVSSIVYLLEEDYEEDMKLMDFPPLLSI